MATYDTTPFSYDPAYGGIPNLPPYTTDKQSTLGTDVQANLVKNLPNYMSLVGKQSQNIGDNLRGVVGEDVTNNLASRAAEWGTATGSPLSQAAATNFLSRYGLTSQAMKQLGGQQLIAQMGATPVQQTNDVSQTSDLAAQQAVYKSAPVPSAAAAASLKAAQSGMAAGKGGISSFGGGSGYSPMQPMAPTAGMGYGSGGSGGGLTPSQSAAGAFGSMGQDWESLFGDMSGSGSSGVSPASYGYQPTSQGTMYMGGAEGYGGALRGTETGGMFDTSGILNPYGSMPDYSAVGADPMGAALGFTDIATDYGLGDMMADFTGLYD